MSEEGKNNKNYDDIKKSDKKFGFIIGGTILLFLSLGRIYKYSQKKAILENSKNLSFIIDYLKKMNKKLDDVKVFVVPGGNISFNKVEYEKNSYENWIKVTYFAPKEKVIRKDSVDLFVREVSELYCSNLRQVWLQESPPNFNFELFYSLNKKVTFNFNKEKCNYLKSDPDLIYINAYFEENVSHPKWEE